MDSSYLAPVRVNPLLVHPSEERSSLDDGWQFALDPEDRGVRERWFAGTEWDGAPIRVPGCWQGQGFGHDGTDTVWDFRLQTRTFRATYEGTGWYRRSFDVPAHWRGRRVFLCFGGAHPSADVWLNGERFGSNVLPFVPFGFEVTERLLPNASNLLVVRVHEKNRLYGLAYNWQGSWSGLYRGVDLVAAGDARLSSCALLPDAMAGDLGLAVNVDGAREERGLTLRVSAAPADGSGQPLEAEYPVSGTAGRYALPMPSPALWSPDSPALYRVDVALCRGDEVLDAQSERTGFVTLACSGKQLRINGEPYYMRGTGDFISCPETGSPDTDRDRWRRKLRALREYGYNYVRCQSYVYTPEYFDAADEVGLLIQSEMGMLGGWSGHSADHVYQWPQPTPDHYPWLKRQWDLTVQRDVNHPSANIYCMSNEFNSRLHYPRTAWECYEETRRIKPGALVLWTDGGYRADAPGDFVNWDERHDTEVDKPLIAHEFRWWSSFPDVRLNDKYDGAIRPYAAEIATEAARGQGQERLLPIYAENSQHLQRIEAKAKMENLRRDHPRVAGICHFDAMDANPSPQGVLNEFYERKVIDADEWRETNGDTVVLCSLGFDDRILEAGSEFNCAFQVSDYSHPPFARPTLEWRLVVGEEAIRSGRTEWAHRPYVTCPAGEIRFRVPESASPCAARLEAVLREGDREVRNGWRVWLLPRRSSVPSGASRYGDEHHTWLREWGALPLIQPAGLGGPDTRVVLTERLDEPLTDYLRSGGAVVLAAGEGMVRPHAPNFGYVRYFFTPPANYPPYEDGQNGTVVLAHPMLGGLPHEGFADLQLFRTIDEAPPLDLAPLGLTDHDPVIRVIHRYPICRPLAYLLERRVERGLLVVCALRLDPTLPEGRYLMGAICAYAGSSTRPSAPPMEEGALTKLIAIVTRTPVSVSARGACVARRPHR